MEPAIKQLLTPSIMHQAAQLAQVDVAEIKFIRAFENFVYGFPFGNGQRILRITHSSHRSLPQVLAELDFIDHLAKGGVNIAQVLPNTTGTLASSIDAENGSKFIVAIFTKANGVGAEGFDFTPEVLQSWGSVIGKMHHLAKSYQPSEGIELRYQWHDDPLVENGLANPQLSAKAKERLKELIDTIDALPKTNHTFGLIHSDLHHGNFFVHHNQVTAFDFDDCCYQYFVHDIAIALYYAMRRGYGSMDKGAFVGYFLKYFIKGYGQENGLPTGWLEHLPLFLELRSFVLHEVLTQKMDVENATPQYLDMVAHMQKLTNGEVPLVSFDIVEAYNNA